MSIDVNEATVSLEKTVIAPAQDTEATLLGVTVVCPVCSTENPPGEKYCGECGFLLSSTPGGEMVDVDLGKQPRLSDVSAQQEYFLKTGDNTVGREFADVLINDPAVSRKHALITLDNGQCWIEDLGSTNGTFVKGARIQPSVKTEIADGDEVRIGSSSLILHLPVTEPADENIVITEEELVDTVETTETQPVDESIESEQAVEEESLETAEPAAMLVKASDPSVAYQIMPGTNTIGRRSGNDIQIVSDPYISGSHAEITVEDGKIWITDLGSTNGTMLNGARLSPGIRTELNIGSEITLGQTPMKLIPVEDAAGDTQSPGE